MKLTLLLICVLLLSGCNSSNEKTANMNLFPDAVGNFETSVKPHYGVPYYKAVYKKKNTEGYIQYEAMEGSNYFLHSKEHGETLFEAPNVRITFNNTDEISLKTYDGKNSLVSKSKDIQLMNDWANAYPYEKFGIKPPPMPIKIELPPADFIKERSKEPTEIEVKRRDVSYELVKLALTANNIKGKTEVSKLDPTTVFVQTDSDADKELINKFLKESGPTLRSNGLRQVFFELSAYKLPSKGDSAASQPNNNNRANNNSIDAKNSSKP